jgi:hypothetical protein
MGQKSLDSLGLTQDKLAILEKSPDPGDTLLKVMSGIQSNREFIEKPAKEEEKMRQEAAMKAGVDFQPGTTPGQMGQTIMNEQLNQEVKKSEALAEVSVNKDIYKDIKDGTAKMAEAQIALDKLKQSGIDLGDTSAGNILSALESKIKIFSKMAANDPRLIKYNADLAATLPKIAYVINGMGKVLSDADMINVGKQLGNPSIPLQSKLDLLKGLAEQNRSAALFKIARYYKGNTEKEVIEQFRKDNPLAANIIFQDSSNNHIESIRKKWGLQESNI